MNHALSRKLVACRWPGYANKFLLVILMGVTGHSIEQVWSRKYKGLFIWSLLFGYFIKNPDYSHFRMFWTYLREYARLFTNQNHTWLASSRAKPRITEIRACSIVIEPWFLKLICPKTRFVITAGDLLISSVILIMFTKLFTNLSIPVIILYLTCHPIRPFYESCIRS